MQTNHTISSKQIKIWRPVSPNLSIWAFHVSLFYFISVEIVEYLSIRLQKECSMEIIPRAPTQMCPKRSPALWAIWLVTTGQRKSTSWSPRLLEICKFKWYLLVYNKNTQIGKGLIVSFEALFFAQVQNNNLMVIIRLISILLLHFWRGCAASSFFACFPFFSRAHFSH